MRTLIHLIALYMLVVFGVIRETRCIAQTATSPIDGWLTRNDEFKRFGVGQSPQLEIRRSLGESARDAARAIALVGGPEAGHGTAWVISRRNRLLVTNAHVADMFHRTGGMMAILNGTKYSYRVEKVWYHPGVRRYFIGDRLNSIRSMNPSDGSVDPQSPDLALLQLSGDGPDLPSELPPATPKELSDLFAQPAAICGFPGHDTEGWPLAGETPAATFHDGSISRLSDFRLVASAPERELQFVQYSMATWPGFSGSPVILPNGHVVAVHNMSRTVKGRDGSILSLPYGIRVDCVWEMIVHHGLQSLISSPIAEENLNISRWLMADERDDAMRKAIELVIQAKMEAVMQISPGSEVRLCDEAIRLAPELAIAYEARAFCNQQKFRAMNRDLSREACLALLEAIRQDRERHLELTGGADPQALIGFIEWARDAGDYTANSELLKKGLALIEQIFAGGELPKVVASSLYQLRGELLDLLGAKPEAIRALTEAIIADPNRAICWEARAKFLEKIGNSAAAEADRKTAKLVREAGLGGLEAMPVSKRRKLLELQANLNESSDVDSTPDVFVKEFDLQEGNFYLIELRSQDFDAILQLLNSTREVVATDDDGLGGPDARIIFRPASTGGFQIQCSANKGRRSGSFTLRVIEIRCDDK